MKELDKVLMFILIYGLGFLTGYFKAKNK